MATKRITDVDRIDSLDGSESFFINKNSSIKQISRGSIFKDTVWDIKHGGTGATSVDTARENLGAQIKHIATTATLSVEGWNGSNIQTVAVSGVTVDNTVLVSPSPENHVIYTKNRIYCSEQANNELTFVCEKVPKDSITVNVVIFG